MDRNKKNERETNWSSSSSSAPSSSCREQHSDWPSRRTLTHNWRVNGDGRKGNRAINLILLRKSCNWFIFNRRRRRTSWTLQHISIFLLLQRKSLFYISSGGDDTELNPWNKYSNRSIGGWPLGDLEWKWGLEARSLSKDGWVLNGRLESAISINFNLDFNGSPHRPNP